MMMKVIEENSANFFLQQSKGIAEKKNAVEVKCNLQFPKLLLHLFSGEDKQPATVKSVTCIHMFESAPQNRIAIAYTLEKADGTPIHLVLVFSVQTKKFTQILRVEEEVT